MLVLRALMTKTGWSAFEHVVKVDTFPENEYRRIYQHVARLHDDTAGDVDIAALRADLHIQYANRTDMLEEMDMVLDRLEDAATLPLDMMEALVKKFLQREASWAVAQYVSDYADKPEFSIAAFADLAARAMEVGDRLDQTAASIFESPLSGAPDNRRVAHSLGISRQFDRSLRGGVAGGELFVYLAGPSVGKTSYLCRTGASHAAEGGSVLHITLEINSRKVIDGYDRCWTTLTTEELETDDGQEKAREARAAVRAAGGHVWISDYSYLTLSANDIGAEVRRMKRERCACCNKPKNITLIVIDYLELMTPNKLPGKEMRQMFKMIGQDTRALARNLDIPVCTAWQVNRAGSEAMLLSKKDISESWDMIKISDIIVGLNQTPEQLNNRRMVVNVIKQRESTGRGVFELYSDLDRMLVRDTNAQDLREQVNAVVRPREAVSEPS
jgi:replicative DNA helicase